MKICIIGAGDVGTFLAEKLATENHEVCVIDKDPVKLENLSLKYNLLTINCDATSEECIRNCQNYDLYIVLTDNDEVNLAISLLIRYKLHSENVIIRFFKPLYAELAENLHFKTAKVVENAVKNLNLLINYPFAVAVWEIGNLLIFKLKINSDSYLNNKTLKDLAPLREKIPFSIILLKRKKRFLIPKGDTELKTGDFVYIAVERERVNDLIKHLQIGGKSVKTLFVLGYSQYIYYWFESLSKTNMEIKFFHPDIKICEEVSAKFPNVYVFQSLLTDDETLLAEGIDSADYVWCLQENDEENIVTALFAKSLNAKRVGVLLKHPQYESFIASSGIDSYILPKKLVASKVYGYLRGKEILEVVELETDVDIYEIIYEGEEQELKNLKLKKCDFIISVSRGNQTFIPTGKTLIKKGDKLLCLKRI